MNLHIKSPTPALTLDYVSPDMFASVLPMVKERLQGVIERSRGRWTMRSMLRDLVAGKIKLLVVAAPSEIKAVIGTHLHAAPSGMQVLQILFCTGEDSKEWLPLLGLIEDHAKANGCAKIEMWSRKGWAKKLPAYRMTHVLLEKDLA